MAVTRMWSKKMPTTPSNFQDALAYARAQHRFLNPPSNYGSTWEGDCQAFCHCAYGLFGGGEPSAYAQWQALHPKQRHATSNTARAPLGALLFSKGRTPFGHIMIAARPFRDGTPAAWSTDLWETGRVGKVPRTAPHTEWGHEILGWGTAINGYDLDLKGH
jgi:hypothetical protein